MENQENGLEPQLSSPSISNGDDTEDMDMSLSDSVIVTNMPDCIFDNEILQKEFEDVFKDFDETATFNYLKSFRRARVNYSCPEFAKKAKIHLHEAELCGNCIKCYMAQPRDKSRDSKDPHLQLPPLEKQFLISPPASPPVGWEQMMESEPIINYDLLAAMASLAPGQAHELHPPSENQPGIVVHICEEPVDLYGEKRVKIPQTKCPERRT